VCLPIETTCWVDWAIEKWGAISQRSQPAGLAYSGKILRKTYVCQRVAVSAGMSGRSKGDTQVRTRRARCGVARPTAGSPLTHLACYAYTEASRRTPRTSPVERAHGACEVIAGRAFDERMNFAQDPIAMPPVDVVGFVGPTEVWESAAFFEGHRTPALRDPWICSASRDRLAHRGGVDFVVELPARDVSARR